MCCTSCANNRGQTSTPSPIKPQRPGCCNTTDTTSLAAPPQPCCCHLILPGCCQQPCQLLNSSPSPIAALPAVRTTSCLIMLDPPTPLPHTSAHHKRPHTAPLHSTIRTAAARTCSSRAAAATKQQRGRGRACYSTGAQQQQAAAAVARRRQPGCKALRWCSRRRCGRRTPRHSRRRLQLRHTRLQRLRGSCKVGHVPVQLLVLQGSSAIAAAAAQGASSSTIM